MPCSPPVRTPELLAPAGSLDAAYAAFQHGADAIYLGLKAFSARAGAENMDLTQLGEIAAYAHGMEGKRRKVYVAINTLVQEHESASLLENLAGIAEMGGDAVIVQDLGVARLARRHFPQLRLHASTQMAIHSQAGAEALRKLGVNRVILARELTLDEIRAASEIPGLETEVFVHGALCYGYSGLCLFSSHLKGLSGNRGKCAYLCRDSFCSEAHGDMQPFSMRDLALGDYVPQLADAGVSALKIEGRMKGPLYVATTTAYYRGLLDGTLTEERKAALASDLQTVYSRSRTTFFVGGRTAQNVTDRSSLGHLGAPIGHARDAIPAAGKQPSVLTFVVENRVLERHDGLHVAVPARRRPFGFPVDSLSVSDDGRRWRSAFEAAPGATVQVNLPPDHPAIPAGAQLYCCSSMAVKRAYGWKRPRPGQWRRTHPVKMEVALTPEAITIDCSAVATECSPCCRSTFSVAATLSPEKTPGKTEQAVRQAFAKLGDTQLSLEELVVANPHGLFAPMSQLNHLRREAVAQFEAKLDRVRSEKLQALITAEQAPSPLAATVPRAPEAWSIKVDRIAYLDAFEDADWENVDDVVVTVSQGDIVSLRDALRKLAATVGADRIRLALSPVTRAWEEAELVEKIALLHGDGWVRWEAGGLAAWSYLSRHFSTPSHSLDLSSDWSVYVLNSSAARQVLELGASRFVLSPEDTGPNLTALLAAFPDQATVLVYQDTPLCLSEACCFSSLRPDCDRKGGCSGGELLLASSGGDELLVRSDACRTIVLNQNAFSLAGQIPELRAAGARHLRAEFAWRRYAPAQVWDIWRRIRQGERPRQTHTGNWEGII